jgi:hypothetical protein
MYVDSAATSPPLPDGFNLPVDDHAPQLASIVLDRRDLTGRRRLLAITEAPNDNRSEYLRTHVDLTAIVDELLQQRGRPADLALSEALRGSRLVAPKRDASGGMREARPWTIAYLEGARLVVAARGRAGALVREEDDLFVIPPDSLDTNQHERDAQPFEPVLYETRLEVGDCVALFCGGDGAPLKISLRPGAFDLCLDQLVESGAHLLTIDIGDTMVGPSHRRTVGLQSKELHGEMVALARMQPVPPIWIGPAGGQSGLLIRPPAVDCLRHYRKVSSSGPGYRARLPCGSPLSLRAFLGLLFALVCIVAAYLAWDYRQANAERRLESLTTVETTLDAALQGRDTAAVVAALAQAEQMVGDLEGRVDGAHIAHLQERIVVAGDFLNGTTRLRDLTRLGLLPAPVAAHDSIELHIAGGDLYLVSYSVFRVDPALQQLTAIVAPGMDIAGNLAGEVTCAAADGLSLIVADQHQVIRFLDGAWHQIAHSGMGEGTDSDLIVGAFNGRFYALETLHGEIWVTTNRFDHRQWLNPEQELLTADVVDVVIDGHIHLITEQGEVVTLADGEVVGMAKPGIGNPIAADLGRVTGQFYLAVRHDSGAQFIRYDRSSGEVAILAMPIGLEEELGDSGHPAFIEMHAFAVDETAERIYWLSDGAIWSARLPASETT